MKRSLVVNALNLLIVISVIAGIVVLALIALTGVTSASSFSIGSPKASINGNVTLIQVPLTIANRGYFSITGVRVLVNAKNAAGDQLLTGTIGPFSVAPGETKQVNASLSLDISKLSQSAVQNLATESQNLTVSADVGASMPPFLGLSGAVSAQVQWGAPIAGFKEGTPVFSQYNSTAIEVKVPVTFNNDNQFLTVSGTGQLKVLNSSGQQVGGGTVTLNVPPNGQFKQDVDLFVRLSQAQFQYLLTNDQTLSYSAVLTVPTEGTNGFSVTQPISYQWGAPVKNLEFGQLTTQAYNATYAKVSVPVSFKDNSSFFSLGGSLGGFITDSSGNRLGSISQVSFEVTPGSSYASSVTGYVPITAVGQGSYVLHLSISSKYGTVTEEVTVNA